MATSNPQSGNASLEVAGGVEMVPNKWRGLFNNEEWLVHDIVVKSFYAFLVIAVIAHMLVYIWRPWIG